MKIKKILALVLAAVLCAGVLTACGSEATYQVKVLDAQGEPYTTGVIVKFMQNGTQVAMQPVGEDGVAKKTLEKGDYTVELVFTNEKITGFYDTETALLSADKTSIEITLYNGVSGEGTSLFATSPVTGEGKDYTAYDVTVGSTYVSLEAEERNYFLFTPSEAGTYEFSVDNNEYVIGYYGSPYFVQSASAAELTDNTFTVSVSESMIGEGGTGTSVLVIGIDGGEEASNCILSIENIGDPEYSVADEPWTEYVTTHIPEPFTLTLGAGEKLIYVDIKGATADNQIVYNEADGYYHYGKADGPVVYVDLGKTSPYVSLQMVIQGDGAAGGAPIREYFYDENGEFVKKEDYTDILISYFDNMDEKLFVYPLNDDLIYIIKNGCNGWWDTESPDFIFDGCNLEIGWMFALCYVK